MPAISKKVPEGMSQNINALHERMLNLIPWSMTHDECLELVAPPEHVDILRNASKYADISASEGWLGIVVPTTLDGTKVPSVHLYMRTHKGVAPPLKPRDPQWNKEAPGATKIMDWMTRRMTYGRLAAMSEYVLNLLAQKCDTGAQVRFLWPAVLQLCQPLQYNPDLSERIAAWSERNSEFKPVRTAPALTSAFRQALQETSEYLTSAALLGKDTQSPPRCEVDIALHSIEAFAFDNATLIRK